MTPRGFVPRAGRPTRSTRWGWETSLPGWAIRRWDIVFAGATALEDPVRGALVRGARKFAKRSSLRVVTPAGPVRTARPVGTRMGKGKGKPAGHRGWAPAGSTLVTFLGDAAARRTALLGGRVGVPLRWRRRFY